MKLIFFSLLTFAVILTACTSSKENTKATVQKYIGEKIPPGTAIVDAEIKSVKENSSSYILEAEVGKVNGYGPSTRPIALQTVLKINLAKTLITSEMGKDYLKIGNVYEMEISQPQKVMDGDANLIWQANTIKKVR